MASSYMLNKSFAPGVPPTVWGSAISGIFTCPESHSAASGFFCVVMTMSLAGFELCC